MGGCREGRKGCPDLPLPFPLIPAAPLAASCQGRLGGKASLGHSLGIGLLQQGAPEFSALSGMHKHEFAILCGQPVVHHHVHPLPKLPDLWAARWSSVGLRASVCPRPSSKHMHPSLPRTPTPPTPRHPRAHTPCLRTVLHEHLLVARISDTPVAESPLPRMAEACVKGNEKPEPCPQPQLQFLPGPPERQHPRFDLGWALGFLRF